MTPVELALPPGSTASRADMGDRRWSIELLWASESTAAGRSVRGGPLPAGLAARFGARFEIPLRPDRPTMVANFVSTLDGVVALDRAGATGGREISRGFEPDRFLMGLLRATADAVLVGAGTVRASRTHAWTPGQVHPPSVAGYAEWRRGLGLSASGPMTVMVSASGNLTAAHLGHRDDGPGVMIVTTSAGARRMRSAAMPDHVEIVPISSGASVPIDGLLELLHARDLRLVLSESGPTLFGELLAAGAIDELFLTLAPHVAGRSEDARRLGLVEGIGFAPDSAPGCRIVSVMRSDGHLFLRYDLSNPDGNARP